MNWAWIRIQGHSFNSFVHQKAKINRMKMFLIDFSKCKRQWLHCKKRKLMQRKLSSTHKSSGQTFLEKLWKIARNWSLHLNSMELRLISCLISSRGIWIRWSRGYLSMINFYRIILRNLMQRDIISSNMAQDPKLMSSLNSKKTLRSFLTHLA